MKYSFGQASLGMRFGFNRRIHFAKDNVSRCQFHQRSRYEFFVRTLFFYVHVTRENNICTKNLYVKCWWNWLQEAITNNQRISETTFTKLWDTSIGRSWVRTSSNARWNWCHNHSRSMIAGAWLTSLMIQMIVKTNRVLGSKVKDINWGRERRV